MRSLTLLLFSAPLALATPQGESEDDTTTLADANDDYALPTSFPAEAMLSGLYGTSIPAAATGAAATSLAGALYTYAVSVLDDPTFNSAASDVYEAISMASDPDAIISSLDGAGFAHADFTTEGWYRTGVPKAAQTALASYWGGVSALETSVLGPQSASGSAESTPTETGTPAAAATGEGAVSSSPGTGGAPVAMGLAMAGLVAGIAMGVFAAV